MTLDEAIMLIEKTATEYEKRIIAEKKIYPYETIRMDGYRCIVEEHRQVAEWLKELKELRLENKKLREQLRANRRDTDYFRMMSEDHGFY